MKKSELTQLTQIIEHIVAKEVRKQLPAIIAETFQNMMGKSVVTEHKKTPVSVQDETVPREIEEEPEDFKASLRELFAGTPVMRQPEQSQVRPTRQFTKDPKLNQILNETVSDLRYREGLVGNAAFQGGYSPTLNMIPGFNPAAAMMPMEEASPEPSFMRNAPSIPIGRPPVLVEGQTSTHAPLSALPEGVSALDVVKHVATPPEVKHALTRNYSAMMKLIDKKKGKV